MTRKRRVTTGKCVHSARRILVLLVLATNLPRRGPMCCFEQGAFTQCFSTRMKVASLLHITGPKVYNRPSRSSVTTHEATLLVQCLRPAKFFLQFGQDTPFPLHFSNHRLMQSPWKT
jgi:hypothetical protein